MLNHLARKFTTENCLAQNVTLPVRKLHVNVFEMMVSS